MNHPTHLSVPRLLVTTDERHKHRMVIDYSQTVTVLTFHSLQTQIHMKVCFDTTESLLKECPDQAGPLFLNPSSWDETFIRQNRSLSSTKLSSSNATPNALMCGFQMDARKQFLFALLSPKYSHLVLMIYLPLLYRQMTHQKGHTYSEESEHAGEISAHTSTVI